jgi:hypothetical protein
MYCKTTAMATARGANRRTSQRIKNNLQAISLHAKGWPLTTDGALVLAQYRSIKQERVNASKRLIHDDPTR